MLRNIILIKLVMLLCVLSSGRPVNGEVPTTYLIKVKVKQGSEKQPKLLAEPSFIVANDRQTNFMTGVEDAVDKRLLGGTRLQMHVTRVDNSQVVARCKLELAETDLLGEEEEPIEVSRQLDAKFSRTIPLEELVRIPLTKAGDTWMELTVQVKDGPASARRENAATLR